MAGFAVSYAGGKLVIGSYTLPNPAVKFLEGATLEMWFAELQGDDVEVVDGIVTYPRVNKGTRANIPLIVGDRASAAGVAASDRARQLKENIAGLNAVAASTTTGSGVTTVVYTPWVGATDRTITNVVILPPIIGAFTPGAGVKVGLSFILPSGAVT